MKRILSTVLVVVLIMSLPLAAVCADASSLSADILYTLGLVEGAENGYEAERKPTRVEALVFSLRLAGLEDDALAFSGESPFADTPDWAENHMAYAYASGLIKGVDEQNYGSDISVRDKDFFTLVLRILGYSETEGDFSWATSGSVAIRIGMAEAAYTDFTRGDMFDCALAALTCRMKNGNMTLADSLVASGDLDRAKVSALGLSGDRPLTARDISDRYTPAIAFLECYDSSASIINRTPDSNSSGFFISSDGILVSNYHTIDAAIYAVVTLDSGEKFTVDRVLYYDPQIDVSVLKISQIPMGGTEKTSFPYLNMLSVDNVYVGDTVFALGNPLGLQNSLSSGIVSNRAREIDVFTLPMIQNTASISKGSSGGALFNEYGYVIGITSGYFSYGQDMYLAVPIDAVLDADLSVEGYTLSEVAKMVKESATEK